MSAPVLRDYQHTLLADARSKMRRSKRLLIQSPTGSGKTVLTAHMIRTAAGRGLRSWFCVHRNELLDQTSKALWASDVPHGAIAAGRSQTTEPVQVASIMTLARRMDQLSPPDMLIVDEAHHATAASYRKIIEACPDAWVIGLTATPCRTDGRGLDDLFDDMVEGPGVAQLIAAGYLSGFRVVTPPRNFDVESVPMTGGDFARKQLGDVLDTPGITGDAVSYYMKLVHPKTCLVYCVHREHARHVTETYRRAGIDARYVAGDTPKAERDAAIEGFRSGSPRVIVSVDLFGEGLDVPGLAAVQLLRSTQSLSLHLQQIGRALRMEPGKERAIILDHVGNTWRHGLPDDERVWTLEGARKRAKVGEAALGLRQCLNCYATFRSHEPVCPECGVSCLPAAVRQPEEIEGHLEEVDPEEHRRLRQVAIQKRREVGMARTPDDLARIARERGYKMGWVGRQLALRGAYKEGSLDFHRALEEGRKAYGRIVAG